MLRVGLAGILADSAEAFARVPTRTPASYSPLRAPSVNPAELDLVVFRRDDPAGPAELARLAREAAVPPNLAAAWAATPDGAGLDAALQRSLFQVYGFVVGYTEAMHRACRWVRRLTHPVGAALRLPVHVTGETGTGKDLIARAVHRLGPLPGGRFVPVNLAAYPTGLAASALFGHTRGAFTGASADRAGAVAMARDGVLFLDEVGDAPPDVQVMLLRFLDRGEYCPVGADVVHESKTQVVTATNADLAGLVRAGRFRADLFHRLGGLTIRLPPLRDRPDDLPLLVAIFAEQLGLPPGSADEAVNLYRGRDWSGNVRQLRRAVELFALLRSEAGAGLSAHGLDPGPSAGTPAGEESRTLDELRREFDRRVLSRRLRRFGGDTRATAQSLGISRRSVYDLARRLGLDVKDVSQP